MFVPKTQTQHNPLGYLLWRWLLRKNGKFTAWLEECFFGPSHGLNNYDELISYKRSHIKPDKHYSILPTVLAIAGNTNNKTVVDLGCGTGFFTIPFAEKSKKVYGVDNSSIQLDLATQHPNVVYLKKDIFIEPLPFADVIVAPFVVNYATTTHILRHLFQKLYDLLPTKGRLVIIADLPNNKKLERFGASKRILGTMDDESPLQIDILNGKEKICTLNAIYFKPETIEQILRSIGFKNICWHRPIISQEGIDAMGSDFWNGYIEDPELGYITTTK